MIIGLEKEMLVFKEDFSPRNYKNEELTKFFTTDFADNQVEIISKPDQNIHSIVDQMYEYLNSNKLVNYNVWPLSQPGLKNYVVKNEALGQEAKAYRDKLKQKYPTYMLNISGIHFNFSFNKKIKNKEEYYFDLMKKIYIFSPLIIQFFSFTPLYESGINDKGLSEINKNKGLKNSISLRNSYKYGYSNEMSLDLNYKNYKEYKKSIKTLIKNKKILKQAEIYSKIRLKEIDNNIYLELRFIDLNPYNRLGIKVDDLIFLKKIIEYIDSINKLDIDNKYIEEANENFELVALNGLDKTLSLNINNKKDSLKNHTVSFLNEISQKSKLNDVEKFIFNKKLKDYQDENLDINKFINEINKKNLSIQEYGKAKAFKKEEFSFLLPKHNLELSTKILITKAQNLGYKVQILDEHNNIIKIYDKKDYQYVIQATKTNSDKYVNILLMENKLMTKNILKENKIKVPNGEVLTNKEELDYKKYVSKKIVVKPIDTNYGQGITILNKKTRKKEILKALDYAFEYSNRVIIEEFFEGMEYRFLVIDQKVVSVVKRTPANIIGDGKSTIKELVTIKNNNKLRAKGYKTPAEKINIGNIEINYLKNQKLKTSSILKENELIYLRENSNVSTGGDSEEVFDKIPEYFKNIAIQTAKALDVKICGVDMIINSNFDDYTIIEANFNPAIQMHTYPVYGIGKNPAKDILNLIFNKKS